MKFPIKILSVFMAANLLITPISNAIYNNNSELIYNNYSNLKIGDKLYLNKIEQYVVVNKNNYLITKYTTNNEEIYNVIVKNKRNLTKEENKKYLILAKKDIDNLPKFRSVALTVIAVISGVATLVGTTIAVDSIYFKPDRDQVSKAENVQNGWVKIYKDHKTMWFYKENGNFKKGWHWDGEYNGWYYFYDIQFNFLLKQTVNATLMFNPRFEKSRWLKINDNWYEFENGGKLIQHSGWRKYNNKWLYHIPGDYGAVANRGLYIDGKWYDFDYNGYWIKK
ncbi:hypothetical protein ABGF26_00360 [Helcococcus ovis]|uniref:hypothetical protein n=1 Tax=Helcococcus ovis TaxID=72026 RepID=UPI0038BC716D